MFVDRYNIKQQLIKLVIESCADDVDILEGQELNKFCKYLALEYTNNTSKNSLNNRINSLCNTIVSKYEKYIKIIDA